MVYVQSFPTGYNKSSMIGIDHKKCLKACMLYYNASDKLSSFEAFPPVIENEPAGSSRALKLLWANAKFRATKKPFS